MVAQVPDPGRALTTVVTRLRRTLRTSIRSDFPWERLPMAQVELLLAVHDRQPVRVGALATELRLAQSTVSGLVQQVVEAGFAERGVDPQDRRVAVVALTDRGEVQLREWEKAHERRLGVAFQALSADEQRAVTSALPALSRLIDRLAEQS